MKAGSAVCFLIFVLIGAGYLLSEYRLANQERATLRSQMEQLQNQNAALQAQLDDLNGQVNQIAAEKQALEAQLLRERQQRSACQIQPHQASQPAASQRTGLIDWLMTMDTGSLVGGWAAAMFMVGAAGLRLANRERA